MHLSRGQKKYILSFLSQPDHKILPLHTKYIILQSPVANLFKQITISQVNI